MPSERFDISNFRLSEVIPMELSGIERKACLELGADTSCVFTYAPVSVGIRRGRVSGDTSIRNSSEVSLC